MAHSALQWSVQTARWRGRGGPGLLDRRADRRLGRRLNRRVNRRVAALLALGVLTASVLTIGLVGTGQALPELVPPPVMVTAARAPVPVWRTVQVHGVSRRYLLALPVLPRQLHGGRVGAAGAPVPRPLVVAFHGLWQHPGKFATATGLLAAASANGVVLAVPDARNGIWNDGRLGRHGTDDDAFFMALVAQLARRHLVDPHRVTVAGFSNGAGMAMEIASRHPRAVAAMVSVCGELLAAPGSVRPRSPVTSVFVHGTSDRVQPWNGRPRWNSNLVAYISVPHTVDAFVTALGRHGGASTAQLAAGHNRVTRWQAVTSFTWLGAGGRSVVLYRLAGYGHAWPVEHAVHEPRHGRIVAAAPIDATAITITTALTAGVAAHTSGAAAATQGIRS